VTTWTPSLPTPDGTTATDPYDTALAITGWYQAYREGEPIPANVAVLFDDLDFEAAAAVHREAMAAGLDGLTLPDGRPVSEAAHEGPIPLLTAVASQLRALMAGRLPLADAWAPLRRLRPELWPEMLSEVDRQMLALRLRARFQSRWPLASEGD
jgi:hypothetical protein